MNQSLKFHDPEITASGERRAAVRIRALETVWFNTGTLCNLTCENCYIESSPKNDRLAYLGRAEVRAFLDEASQLDPRPTEIGFTGGEPFMNRDIIEMIEDSLAAGFRVLVLTNAMRPMQRLKSSLAGVGARFPNLLSLRVSLDHYTPDLHERLRGEGTWAPTIEGLVWLARNRFDVSVAGRMNWGEPESAMRDGYQRLFSELDIDLDVQDPARLVLFPEMRDDANVPEITERCWGTLNKSPDSVMCANSRMVVKRKGAERPAVVACTLLPYDSQFEVGDSLREAISRPVALNHPHCARFCVLGGASCSARQ